MAKGQVKPARGPRPQIIHPMTAQCQVPNPLVLVLRWMHLRVPTPTVSILILLLHSLHHKLHKVSNNLTCPSQRPFYHQPANNQPLTNAATCKSPRFVYQNTTFSHPLLSFSFLLSLPHLPYIKGRYCSRATTRPPSSGRLATSAYNQTLPQLLRLATCVAFPTLTHNCATSLPTQPSTESIKWSLPLLCLCVNRVVSQPSVRPGKQNTLISDATLPRPATES